MRIQRGRVKGGHRHFQTLDSNTGRLLRARAATRAAIRSNLGAKTDALRQHLGLSIAALATELGWTVSEATRLLYGQMTPSAGQYEDLDRWAKGAGSRIHQKASDCKTPYELAVLAQQRAKVDREGGQ